MAGWRGLVRDVRALGVGAPLRGGYEVSKRLGGHSVVFGRLVTEEAPPAGVSPFSFGEVPDAVRDRTLSAADAIAGGTVEIFGRPLPVGEVPDWHGIIDDAGIWPADPWWKIDIRSEDRIGDIKWAWELGRHRHLVILARAVHLSPDEDSYSVALNRHLASWLDANPPETGIHWYSNLEISLRAIAWLQILALAGDSLDESVSQGMWQHLYHSGRHIVADLPYTYSTMRNNHMLGDALGLIALGKAFGEDSKAKKWVTLGNKMFNSQLIRHCHKDGSMIEDSVSYHRFVLEMLEMRVLLGDAPEDVTTLMGWSAQFLARLGVLEREVPQYGDWDEGRVLAVAEKPSRLDGSVLLGFALAGSGAPEEWRVYSDEVAWYSGVGEPLTPERPASGVVGGGIARASRGAWTAWLKGGAGKSHGHADLSSLSIAHDGRWIIGDPGTGTYNGPLEIRNYFRTSAAHDVVRIHGEDQYGPHRAFRWENKPPGVLGEPIVGEDVTVLWSVHSAYHTSDGRGRIARIVVLSDDTVAVADHIDGESLPCSLSFPLHPGVTWAEGPRRIGVGDESFALASPAPITEVSGSTDPYRGWWSDTYGETEPSIILDCSSSKKSIIWGLGDKGGSVHALIGTVERSVTFKRGSVLLTVTVDGEKETRSVAL